MEMATQHFIGELNGGGTGLNEGVVSSALGGLLGGDGANDGILAQQILSLFGESQIDDFASKLNLDQATASAGLAGMLPDLIDSSSKAGSLLGAAGGIGDRRT
jgi:uncharacterized protein YidB (DUF937 family)